MASCILWKCVALWKWLAISFARSVDSTLANVNNIRHPIACMHPRHCRLVVEMSFYKSSITGLSTPKVAIRIALKTRDTFDNDNR